MSCLLKDTIQKSEWMRAVWISMDRTCKCNVDWKGYVPEYLHCDAIYVNFEPHKTVF